MASAIVRSVFQFTPLREGRPKADEWLESGKSISIHAPPRGATFSVRSIRPHSDFNSRPSARGDLPSSDAALVTEVFQFTPLREGRRHGRRRHRQKYEHFNSRPSARGDSATSFIVPPSAFQFTPLREGRRFRCGSLTRISYFNSRPSARGDVNTEDRFACTIIISIHAPPRGATGEIQIGQQVDDISIHAPPRGAT